MTWVLQDHLHSSTHLLYYHTHTLANTHACVNTHPPLLYFCNPSTCAVIVQHWVSRERRTIGLTWSHRLQCKRGCKMNGRKDKRIRHLFKYKALVNRHPCKHVTQNTSECNLISISILSQQNENVCKMCSLICYAWNTRYNFHKLKLYHAASWHWGESLSQKNITVAFKWHSHSQQ